MPREQVKPLPGDEPEPDRSKLALVDKRELDEIVEVVSKNFARDLDAIMEAQEKRRRARR